MKTQVFITIDAEFSIGGAFGDPARYRPVAEPALVCEVNGRSRGLGFILETLSQHGLAATFFVEVLNSFYFGAERMGRWASQIHEQGQDVQMHLHPCWEYFRQPDWEDRLASDPPNDRMDTRDEDHLADLIDYGKDVFRTWGLPEPVALRAGNLHAERHLYGAMARAGLPLASNVGVGLHRPADPALHVNGGVMQVEGVWEFPVLTYRDMMGRSKILTVTGTSLSEFRFLLESLHERQAGPVVILTHADEYVISRDPQFRDLQDNCLNQRRLQALCAWLRDNDDRFEVATFGDLGRRLSGVEERPSPEIQAPAARTLRRLMENWLNERMPRLFCGLYRQRA